MKELIDRSNDQRELIKLTQQNISDQEVNAVNARELHEFLGVGRKFNTWIKDRIEKYGFLENLDYVIVENLSFPNPGNAKSRSQVLKDYYISLDMAKELSMVENNDKGREARQYFIQCEKQLHRPMSQLEMISVMASEMVKAQKQLEQVTADNAIQDQRLDNIENNLQQKADLADRLADSALLLSATQMGSVFGLSAKAFNQKLKEHKVAYKTTYEDERGITRTHFVFYAPYKDAGLGKPVLWNKRGGAFGTCLKFYPSSVAFFEEVFDMKANRQVLESLL